MKVMTAEEMNGRWWWELWISSWGLIGKFYRNDCAGRVVN